MKLELEQRTPPCLSMQRGVYRLIRERVNSWPMMCVTSMEKFPIFSIHCVYFEKNVFNNVAKQYFVQPRK